ncbi:hypothetical protein (Partial), partial [Ectocarpus siliculosus]
MGCAQSCQQSNRLGSGGGGGGRSGGLGGGAVQVEGDFGRDGRGGVGVGREDNNKPSVSSISSSHRQQQTGRVQKPATSPTACHSLDRRRGLGRGEAGPPGASDGEGWDAVAQDDGEQSSSGSDKQPMQPAGAGAGAGDDATPPAAANNLKSNNTTTSSIITSSTFSTATTAATTSNMKKQVSRSNSAISSASVSHGQAAAVAAAAAGGGGAAVAAPAVAALQGLLAAVRAARACRRQLDALSEICDSAVAMLIETCQSPPPPAPTTAPAAAAAALLMGGGSGGGGGGGGSNGGGSGVVGDIHGSGNGSDTGAASLVAAAAAAAAGAAPSQPPVSRNLRAAAELLGAEVVGITALAEACSPRGILESLALATRRDVSKRKPGEGGHRRGGRHDGDAGGGEPGVGAEEEEKEGAAAAAAGAAAATPVAVVSLRKEKAAKFRATAERVRLIVGRLEVSRDVTSPPAAAAVAVAAAEGGGVAAPVHGGDVSFFPAARAVWEDEEEGGGGEAEREDEGVEAFRSEFVESVEEAGGLKALTLSWTGVARLEEAFLAWVVEAGGNTGTDLKAEILRVSSLAEALVKDEARPLAGQGSSSSSPGFPSLSRLLGADGGGAGGKGETVVTFAGSSGAGKACLAAEVVGRRDVRAKFGDSVLWLQVGRSGGTDLACLLHRLAHAYHRVVLCKRLRNPPPLPPISRFRGPRNGEAAAEAAAAAAAAAETPGDGGSEEAAAATAAAATAASAEATATAAATWFTPYMSGLGLRCLVVLEDVWEAEVVAAASAAGFDLVVTTAFRDLVPDSPLCTRLDVGGLARDEARSLLRRCSGLAWQAPLPPSADGVIKACGALALPLTIAGSLPAVRCRSDEAAWANLYSILSHKATRLGESSSCSENHRRGRSNASTTSSAGGGGGGGGPASSGTAGGSFLGTFAGGGAWINATAAGSGGSGLAPHGRGAGGHDGSG